MIYFLSGRSPEELISSRPVSRPPVLLTEDLVSGLPADCYRTLAKPGLPAPARLRLLRRPGSPKRRLARGNRPTAGSRISFSLPCIAKYHGSLPQESPQRRISAVSITYSTLPRFVKCCDRQRGIGHISPGAVAQWRGGGRPHRGNARIHSILTRRVTGQASVPIPCKARFRPKY
jgi:hypothetical protein